MNKPKIVTKFVHPPIPVRQFDYCAWIEGHDEEGRPEGWGATELEARIDLLEILIEKIEAT